MITRQQRNYDTLMDAAMRIHAAVLEAETVLHSRYPVLAPRLPATLAFVSSQELCDLYPGTASGTAGNRLCEGAPGRLRQPNRLAPSPTASATATGPPTTTIGPLTAT